MRCLTDAVDCRTIALYETGVREKRSFRRVFEATLHSPSRAVGYFAMHISCPHVTFVRQTGASPRGAGGGERRAFSEKGGRFFRKRGRWHFQKGARRAFSQGGI